MCTEVLDGHTSPKLRVMYDPTSTHYDMTGDKWLYVFNHTTFPQGKTRGFKYPQSPRTGSDRDFTRLCETFSKVGFTVEEPCSNYTYDQVVKKMQQVCQMDHRTTSCVAFVFLTHGDASGNVSAADKPYLMSDVVDLVLREPSLAGKPKLFFCPVTTLSAVPKPLEISLVSDLESLFFASKIRFFQI